MGATPTVLAATDPNAKRNDYAGPSGFREMWGDAKWGCVLNNAIWDEKLQDALWQKCEELTNANFTARL